MQYECSTLKAIVFRFQRRKLASRICFWKKRSEDRLLMLARLTKLRARQWLANIFQKNAKWIQMFKNPRKIGLKVTQDPMIQAGGYCRVMWLRKTIRRHNCHVEPRRDESERLEVTRTEAFNATGDLTPQALIALRLELSNSEVEWFNADKFEENTREKTYHWRIW